MQQKLSNLGPLFISCIHVYYFRHHLKFLYDEILKSFLSVEVCLTENKVSCSIVNLVKFRVDNGGGDGIGCFETG